MDSVPLARLAVLLALALAASATAGVLVAVPVFHLVRTAFDVDGRAVEVCDTVMAADAFLLSYELPAH